MSTAGDKVSVICPTCNKRLLVPAASIGKQGRCPSCKAVFLLEQVYEAETVQPGQGFAPANDMWGGAAPSQPTYQQQPMYPQQTAGYSQQPTNDMWGSAGTGAGSSNPFGDTNTTTTSNPYSSPQYSPASYTPYQPAQKKGFWDSSVLGGLALMAIAVVWFFGGLLVNIIFFYPPILFIIGLVVMIKGLASGSVAGN